MARRRLVLVPGFALALTLLLSAVSAGVAAGGMGCHSGLERDAQVATVRLVQSCMDPLVARVPTGAVVTFVNADQTLHAVTGASNRWGTYDDLRAGASVSYRFDRDGVYPYFCYIHPGMIGAIVVGDGGPGGTGDAVQRVATTTKPTTEPTTAPSPEPTARATPAPTGTPAALVLPAAGTAGTSGPRAPEPPAPVILALLVVLLGAGAAYALGLIPRLPSPRARSR